MTAIAPDPPDPSLDTTVTDARARLGELVTLSATCRRPIYLTKNGRRVGAVIDAELLARVLDLAEDMEDIRDAEEAEREMRETGATPIPWDAVAAELGLT